MKKQVLLIAICLSAASVALADPAKNFARNDTDKDGFISKDEYLAMKAKLAEKKGTETDPAKDAKSFNKKDTDGDGKLTLEEFSAGSK